MVVTSHSPQETRRLGRAVGDMMSGGEVVWVEGPLGAGKTVFVQGLASGLGIAGPVQSPSFVLERHHYGRLHLRHLDLYRLTAEEALEAGLLSDDDQEDTVTVIEWADRAMGHLTPTMTVKIEFSPSGPEDRIVSLNSSLEHWRKKVRDAASRSSH